MCFAELLLLMYTGSFEASHLKYILRSILSYLGHFLIIMIFMCSGWPMVSENNLLFYQQDLQLCPYVVKWQMAIDRGLPKFPKNYFAK